MNRLEHGFALLLELLMEGVEVGSRQTVGFKQREDALTLSDRIGALRVEHSEDTIARGIDLHALFRVALARSSARSRISEIILRIMGPGMALGPAMPMGPRMPISSGMSGGPGGLPGPCANVYATISRIPPGGRRRDGRQGADQRGGGDRVGARARCRREDGRASARDSRAAHAGPEACAAGRVEPPANAGRGAAAWARVVKYSCSAYWRSRAGSESSPAPVEPRRAGVEEQPGRSQDSRQSPRGPRASRAGWRQPIPDR